MAKKRKHHETCPSCAFIHAYRLKYGKRRHDEKPFSHLVHSAIKIAAIVLAKLENEQKARFIANMLAYTAKLEGKDVGGVLIRNDGVITPSEIKEPTKH
jgi:hypothetical protein